MFDECFGVIGMGCVVGSAIYCDYCTPETFDLGFGTLKSFTIPEMLSTNHSHTNRETIQRQITHSHTRITRRRNVRSVAVAELFVGLGGLLGAADWYYVYVALW